jgi:hypothetical protein
MPAQLSVQRGKGPLGGMKTPAIESRGGIPPTPLCALAILLDRESAELKRI